MKKYLFDITTPLKFNVHCTEDYWSFISTEKHPAIRNKLDEVKLTLSQPDEIRRSKKDLNIYLFYRNAPPRWICAVTKSEDGSGFLVTAYITDKIKAGETIWKK